MIKLDCYDIATLRSQYDDAPDFEEIRAGVASVFRYRSMSSDDVRRRLYRLSRHGLCACDRAGMHPGEPRCWSLSPEGERVVETTDGDWWNKEDFVYEYRRAL